MDNLVRWFYEKTEGVVSTKQQVRLLIFAVISCIALTASIAVRASSGQQYSGSIEPVQSIDPMFDLKKGES